jgi:hypothetical protein
MPANEISPGGCLAPLRYGRDAVPAQDVAHGLVGDCVPQIGQRSDRSYPQPEFWRAKRTTRFSKPWRRLLMLRASSLVSPALRLN